MARSLLVAAVIAPWLAACGGASFPLHNGYKSKTAEPWKKPKEIKLDDQMAGKADGDLDYKDYRRAKWYVVNLSRPGDLAVNLEVTPPGDDKFDLAMEIIDGQNFNVISKSDKDDDDANELKKSKNLIDLKPGPYLIHLYLEGRLDTCEYDLALKFTPGNGVATDPNDTFPQDVQYPPDLPVVPLQDDTPVQKETPHGHGHGGGGGGGGGGGHTTTTTTTTTTTGGAPVSGRVINVGVSGTNTVITINIGAADGLKDGSKGQVVGVKNGGFATFNCGDHSCKGTVGATVDQVNSSGKVIVNP